MFLKHVMCIGWKVESSFTIHILYMLSICSFFLLTIAFACLFNNNKVNIHSCGVPGLKYNIKVSSDKGSRYRLFVMHRLMKVARL
jgi:hypothetical protein